MHNLKFIAFTVFFILVSQSTSAQSNSLPKANNFFYALYDDGGEHAADACDVINQLPVKLKKSLKGHAGYIGSKQIEFADKNEASIDAFQHYFKTNNDCKKAIEKLGYN